MKLVPLSDRVVLKQMEAETTTASGIVLPGQEKEKPQQAEVIEVGPGGLVDGKEVKMVVKKGDHVIYSKYAGTEVKVDGEELTKPEVLLSKIENGKVGDKLTLTICRIDNNYQTKEFTVTATLVEEKKETPKETTTSSSYVDPYDFYNDFFNGLF